MRPRAREMLVTLDELDESLPNGLHDADILAISLDYVAHVARFDLDVSVDDEESPPGPGREWYRRALLELTGLAFCVIEPPDFGPDYLPRSLTRSGLWTFGLSPVEPPSPLPDGTFEAKLFVNDWNSFIHVAAADARLEWLDEPRRREQTVGD